MAGHPVSTTASRVPRVPRLPRLPRVPRVPRVLWRAAALVWRALWCVPSLPAALLRHSDVCAVPTCAAPACAAPACAAPACAAPTGAAPAHAHAGISFAVPVVQNEILFGANLIETETAFVCACMCGCASVCVSRARAGVCVCARVCACVCALECVRVHARACVDCGGQLTLYAPFDIDDKSHGSYCQDRSRESTTLK